MRENDLSTFANVYRASAGWAFALRSNHSGPDDVGVLLQLVTSSNGQYVLGSQANVSADAHCVLCNSIMVLRSCWQFDGRVVAQRVRDDGFVWIAESQLSGATNLWFGFPPNLQCLHVDGQVSDLLPDPFFEKLVVPIEKSGENFLAWIDAKDGRVLSLSPMFPNIKTFGKVESANVLVKHAVFGDVVYLASGGYPEPIWFDDQSFADARNSPRTVRGISSSLNKTGLMNEQLKELLGVKNNRTSSLVQILPTITLLARSDSSLVKVEAQDVREEKQNSDVGHQEQEVVSSAMDEAVRWGDQLFGSERRASRERQITVTIKPKRKRLA